MELDLPGAELRWYPEWLDPAVAAALCAQLLHEVPWEVHRIRLFGKLVDSPRLSCWIGDADASYRYSGTRFAPHPWPAALLPLRARLAAETGVAFNSVLANRYRDGRDAMGWHSDDERELGAEPLVASLSLGGERRFDLRRKGHTRIEHSLQLAHGSLLVMSGQTQHHWQHQVAKTRKPCAPRLNLTFRLIRTPL